MLTLIISCAAAASYLRAESAAAFGQRRDSSFDFGNLNWAAEVEEAARAIARELLRNLNLASKRVPA